MTHSFWLTCFVVPLIACNTTSEQFTGVPADGVEVTATATRLSNGEDSLAVNIRNRGTAPAFMSRCGQGPLMLVEEFVGQSWTGGVQNFMCPLPVGTIKLGPGESVVEARHFSIAGRFRFVVPVSKSADLSDVSRAASNSFQVP
jgi:hypothetical protein